MEILRQALQSYGALVDAVRDRMLSIPSMPDDGERVVRSTCNEVKRDAANSIIWTLSGIP